MNYSLKKFDNWWTVALIIAIFLIVYLAVLYPWMNHWGATDAEVSGDLPGDGTVPGVVTVSTRGVTVHAPADQVWKWVVQLGQERTGFYSNDWLENLTFADIHNANEIRAQWQDRHQGDLVQGAGGIYGPGIGWHIPFYEPGKAIYLWGPIVVIPIDSQSSRLIVRTYGSSTSWFADTLGKLTNGWMHFVMERGMLLGIKARAERTLGSNALLQLLSSLEPVMNFETRIC